MPEYIVYQYQGQAMPWCSSCCKSRDDDDDDDDDTSDEVAGDISL